jgi:serine/threonine-protein kinase
MEMPAFVGETVGDRYRVLEVRGEGGMATVYRAEDLLLKRRVALKRLREPYAHDAAFLARFRQEAQSAARLRHPNIIAVHDFIESEGSPVLVMEEAEGPNLAEALRALGPASTLIAVAIGQQLSFALREAHRQGLIHRDVKPENVLFTRQLPSNGWSGLLVNSDEPVVKLVDFGIARALGEASFSVDGQVFGTPYYLSPEQALGQPATQASDLYALGVLLYELLSGQRPFTGESPLAITRQHIEASPPRLRSVAPHVPAAAERVVMTAMAKAPEERFASAEEMSTALGHVMSAGVANTAAMDIVSAPLERHTEQAPVTFALIAPSGPVDEATTPPPVTAFPAPSSIGSSAATAATAPEMERVVARTPRWRDMHISPRLIGRGLLASALVAGIVGFLSFASFLTEAFSPPIVQTPSVAGLSGAEARERLTAAGLRYTEGAPVESRSVPAGNVVEQNPSPDAQIRSGGTVTVTLSSGPSQVQVTDVRSQPVNEAVARLQTAGLQVNTNDVVNNTPAGTVLSQEPQPGQSVPVDSQVTLTVSRGPSVAIPNVINVSANQARAQLEGLGFTVRQIATGGGDVCNGCVRRMDPSPGTMAPPGAQVTIEVRIRNNDDDD